jgi:hypothetical protein
MSIASSRHLPHTSPSISSSQPSPSPALIKHILQLTFPPFFALVDFNFSFPLFFAVYVNYSEREKIIDSATAAAVAD